MYPQRQSRDVGVRFTALPCPCTACLCPGHHGGRHLLRDPLPASHEGCGTGPPAGVALRLGVLGGQCRGGGRGECPVGSSTWVGPGSRTMQVLAMRDRGSGEASPGAEGLRAGLSPPAGAAAPCCPCRRPVELLPGPGQHEGDAGLWCGARFPCSCILARSPALFLPLCPYVTGSRRVRGLSLPWEACFGTTCPGPGGCQM